MKSDFGCYNYSLTDLNNSIPDSFTFGVCPDYNNVTVSFLQESLKNLSSPMPSVYAVIGLSGYVYGDFTISPNGVYLLCFSAYVYTRDMLEASFSVTLNNNDPPFIGHSKVPDLCNQTTLFPTSSPTAQPSQSPSASPTSSPTNLPSASPSSSPTLQPTSKPTREPTQSPSFSPTSSPSMPTHSPTAAPSTHHPHHSTLDTEDIVMIGLACGVVALALAVGLYCWCKYKSAEETWQSNLMPD